MSILKDLRATVGNLMEAATSVVSVSSTLVRDGSEFLAKGIAATPKVMEDLASSPKEGYIGFLMERDSISLEEAEEKASLAFSFEIKDVSRGTGRAIARMLEEEE